MRQGYEKLKAQKQLDRNYVIVAENQDTGPDIYGPFDRRTADAMLGQFQHDVCGHSDHYITELHPTVNSRSITTA